MQRLKSSDSGHLSSHSAMFNCGHLVPLRPPLFGELPGFLYYMVFCHPQSLGTGRVTITTTLAWFKYQPLSTAANDVVQIPLQLYAEMFRKKTLCNNCLRSIGKLKALQTVCLNTTMWHACETVQMFSHDQQVVYNSTLLNYHLAINFCFYFDIK